MLKGLGLSAGGLALIAYGLWLVLNPEWIVAMDRRRIERSRWMPAFWREWRLGYLESGQYHLTLRISGAGAVLMGGLLFAMGIGLIPLR